MMAHIKTKCPVCKKDYYTMDTISGFQWYCSTECEDSLALKDDDKTDPEIKLHK